MSPSSLFLPPCSCYIIPIRLTTRYHAETWLYRSSNLCGMTLGPDTEMSKQS